MKIIRIIESEEQEGWIAVDLDGTLAEFHKYDPKDHSIGKPVPKMLERVKKWLDEGRDVRLMTARAAADEDRDVHLRLIKEWMLEHLGRTIPITCSKDQHMIELWDDRAVQVVPNTGERADGKE